MFIKSLYVASFLCVLGVSGFQYLRIQSLTNELIVLTNRSMSEGLALKEKQVLQQTITLLREQLKASMMSGKVKKVSDKVASSIDNARLNTVGLSNAVIEQLSQKIDQKLERRYGVFIAAIERALPEDDLFMLKQLLSQSVSYGLVGDTFDTSVPIGEAIVANSIDDQIKVLLDEDNYALYTGFKQHGSQSTGFVLGFEQVLSALGNEPLTSDQNTQLTLLLVRAKSTAFEGVYGSLEQALADEAFLKNQDYEEVIHSESSLYLRQEIITNRIFDQASQILSQEQLALFAEQPAWDYLSENAITF